jgi:uncharacterized protein
MAATVVKVTAADRFGALLAELPLPATPADAAHDHRHIVRVLETAVCLAEDAGAALDVVVPAAWLHDLVQYSKVDPRNATASRASADAAVALLHSIDYYARRAVWFPNPAADAHADTDNGAPGAAGERFYARVHHAVAAHSFSAGIAATSLEAEVVRDADRLDALGAIGIARVFATSGAMARALYHEADPWGVSGRALDDKEYALDHFAIKLLRLTFCTAAAEAAAARRRAAMHAFLDALRTELGR